MVKLISSYYVDSGLDSKLWGTHFDKEQRLVGTHAQQEYFHQLVIDEINKAQESSKEFLIKNQGLVRFLVAQLVKNQSLNGDEYQALNKYFHEQSLTTAETELLSQKFRKKSTINSALKMNSILRQENGKAQIKIRCEGLFL